MGTFQRHPDAGALYIQPCSRPQMCLILSYAYNKGLGGSLVECRDVLNPDTPVSPSLAASLSLRTDPPLGMTSFSLTVPLLMGQVT